MAYCFICEMWAHFCFLQSFSISSLISILQIDWDFAFSPLSFQENNAKRRMWLSETLLSDWKHLRKEQNFTLIPSKYGWLSLRYFIRFMGISLCSKIFKVLKKEWLLESFLISEASALLTRQAHAADLKIFDKICGKNCKKDPWFIQLAGN